MIHELSYRYSQNIQQQSLIKSKHYNRHLIKQIRQSVWYFHLFAWRDWDSPDTVHVGRVAVGETRRGEVPTAVLQTVSTSLKRQTESLGQRWLIMHICEDRTRAQHAEVFIHCDIARCHAKRLKKKSLSMPKFKIPPPAPTPPSLPSSTQSCMLCKNMCF